MQYVPLLLFVFLFSACVLAPLRWSIVAFLLLSTIDLGSVSSGIGLLNTAKAMVLPVYMLWRFRAYAGHDKVSFVPIAWAALTLYVAIASTWTLFPPFAIKMIGHMVGSLIIALMLIRATKGGYLTPSVVAPVAIGTLAIASFHYFFVHSWGGETERFTTFSGAQPFAAFVTALFCVALCARTLRVGTRAVLCAALAAAVVLNGSRLWTLGTLVCMLAAVFVSGVKTWLKVLVLSVIVVGTATTVGGFDSVMGLISHSARTNRVANAITAAYEGNFKSSGLGTYKLRQELYRRTIASIEQGSGTDLVFGHGTCNGALVAATLSKNPDPNRAMHDEWLRALYEWGIIGLLLWMTFIASLFLYAVRGSRRDPAGFAKPLLIYLPAFALGLTGENMIAGAGNCVSVGLLMLVAFASISHRYANRRAQQSLWPRDARTPQINPGYWRAAYQPRFRGVVSGAGRLFSR